MNVVIKSLLLAVCALGVVVSPVAAQEFGSANIAESFTPPDIAPGSPAGSFALSGFETVSPYGGGLSFALPLLNVGGRGEAGYTMYLHIQSPWTIDVESCGTDPVCWNRYPRFDWWGGRRAGYSPGVMHVRYAADMLNCTGTASDWKTTTRITFSTGEGSEIEFRDVIDWGNPHTTNNISTGCTTIPTSPGAISSSNRGTTFRSTDGSAIIFESDDDIIDGDFGGVNYVRADKADGELRFPDGRVYRIDDGMVTSIRDRNGNLTTFAYESGSDKLDYITDPLDRIINVEVGVAGPLNWNGDNYYNFDRITYSGYDGGNRVILILYRDIGVLGTQTRPLTEENTDSQAECFGEDPLFENISSDLTGNPSCHSPDMPAYIVLPNDESYSLQYNAYGEISEVTLPTGGKIAYEWDGAGFTGNPAGEYGDQAIFREVTTREVYFDGTGSPDQTTNFSRTRDVAGCGGSNTLYAVLEHRDSSNALVAKEAHCYGGHVTNSLGISDPTAHAYWYEGQKKKSEQYDEQSSWSNVIRTSEDTWELRTWDLSGSEWWTAEEYAPSYDPRITETLTTLNDAGIKTKTVNVYDKYNNPTSVKEYAYAATPTTVLRETATTYQYANQSAYEGATVHLLRAPYLVQVKTGGGTNVAQTRYTYDAGSPQNNSGMSGYSAPPTSYRGNVTKLERWKSGSSWIDTDYAYDIAGNVVLLTDPRNNSWDIDYSGTYEFSRITQITDPLSRTRTADYDFETSGCTYSANLCGTGAMTEFIDENSGRSCYAYGDDLDRLTKAIVGVEDSGWECKDSGDPTPTSITRKTTLAYNDSTRTVTVEADQEDYNDGDLKTETLYDGMGRVSEIRQYDFDTVLSGDYNKTLTEYDALGRVWRTSNPLRPSGSPDWTELSYDALGRVIEVKAPGNALTKTFYEGAETVVRDPAGVRRLSETDALGRLIEVIEDPSCQSWEAGCSGSHTLLSTTYQYDTLDNLLTVSQGSQTRTFTYDALSRLLTASNPESGTITYTYDANGNLETRKDARNITATNTYNALNQILVTSYSDSGSATPTPWVSRTYGTAAPNKGRLVEVQNGANYRQYTYDELGRVIASTQAQVGEPQYDFSYTYNRDGSTASITYPSGKVVSYAYDEAARPITAGKAGDSDYYLKSAAYAPHGAPTSMTLGNDLVEATTYNNRLQPTLMNAGSGMLKLTFGYGSANANNGNVITQQIEAPGSPSALNATQTYGYDALNRLASVTEGSAWSRAYHYDIYGNRGMQGATPTPALAPLCATSSGPGCNSSTTALTPAYTASNNRLNSTWATYDAAGNMLAFKDPFGAATRTWAAFYDAENKQRFYCDGTTAACSSANDTAEYVYDGEGNRVQKVVAGGETVTYVYDAFGRLAAEYSTAGPSGTAGSYFRTTDHLGSTRLVTDGNGDVYDRRDFFPFGEQILASSTYSNRHYVTGYNNSDPASAHLFTAKERDDESGLDYFLARYYSSSLGRFTGADAPFADQSPGSPQSWNLYGYVRNNPLKATDPTGRAMLPCGGEDEVTCPASADEQFEQAKQQYNSGNYVGAGLALLGAVATKFDLPGGLSPNPVAAIKITSAMGAKGAAALADTAETISKADDSVTLFRAVMPGEAADLAKTQGAFRNPKGIEGKYFSETLEGAESYASQASQAFGDGPFSFVETTIPKGAIDPGMRALPDRGIPTVVVPTGKLPLLSPARSVVPR